MSYLKRLHITSLRNLNQVALDVSPTINLFCGENGSGKTSLLEAVSLLGLGRSFRSHKTRSLIQHEAAELTVFGEVLTHLGNSRMAVGLQKSRNGESLIRINGETVTSAAALAQQLPLQIINADSFQLLEGSPSQRRRFLDWTVFHVKPAFIGLWRRLQRVMKQRNSLLKRDKIGRLELAPWDSEFVQLAEDIHQLRQSVFTDFARHYHDIAQAFSGPLTGIEISYSPGWDLEQGMAAVLDQAFERDSRDGYSHYGPQRADLRFTIKGRPVADVLSRGQEKALISVLHIVQAQLYREKQRQPCVFLVDDLLAELDNTHARFLTDWLMRLGGQVFVTGIDKNNLLSVWGGVDIDQPEHTIKVFHVKQGTIQPDSD